MKPTIVPPPSELTPSLHHYYLRQMGITDWRRRPANEPAAHSTVFGALQALAAKVAQCKLCALCETRTQTVFARGNPNGRVMIVGEVPGLHEDQQGRPFVGKAGQLLDRMIQSMGLTLQDVYIANVLKCRPPQDRDPQALEIAQCRAYLTEQIQLVKPKLIIAVGRFAGQFITDSTASMTMMRQTLYQYQGIKAIISYHPAYLLRHPKDKKAAYQDWSLAKTMLSPETE